METLPHPIRRDLVVAVASRRGAARQQPLLTGSHASSAGDCRPSGASARLTWLTCGFWTTLTQWCSAAPLHPGHWLRPALKLRRQAQDTQLLGLWLFSAGSISQPS